MGGGKSSSSADNTQTTSSLDAAGVVGDLVQATGNVSIVQELPEGVVDVFKQLTNLLGQTIDTASAAGSEALYATQELAASAAQPDLVGLEGYQKQVYILIGAIALVAAVVLWRRR